MRCNYRHRMWRNCKKPVHPTPQVIPVESIDGGEISIEVPFNENGYITMAYHPENANEFQYPYFESDDSEVSYISSSYYDTERHLFCAYVYGAGEGSTDIYGYFNSEQFVTIHVNVTAPVSQFPTNDILVQVSSPVETKNSKKKSRAVEATGDFYTARLFASDYSCPDFVYMDWVEGGEPNVEYYGQADNEYYHAMFEGQVSSSMAASIEETYNNGLLEDGVVKIPDSTWYAIETFLEEPLTPESIAIVEQAIENNPVKPIEVKINADLTPNEVEAGQSFNIYVNVPGAVITSRGEGDTGALEIDSGYPESGDGYNYVFVAHFSRAGTGELIITSSDYGTFDSIVIIGYEQQSIEPEFTGISSETGTIYVGESTAFSIYYTPSDADDFSNVTVGMDTSDVLAITETTINNGEFRIEVYGLDAGECTVFATDGFGNTFESRIEVLDNSVPVETISAPSEDSITVDKYDYGYISFSYTPLDANNLNGLIITSSDDGIAQGEIVSFADGTAIMKINGLWNGIATISYYLESDPNTTYDISVTVRATSPYVPTSNTIAYFPLKGDVLDRSNNGFSINNNSCNKGDYGWTFTEGDAATIDESNIKFAGVWYRASSAFNQGYSAEDLLWYTHFGEISYCLHHSDPTYSDVICLWEGAGWTDSIVRDGMSFEEWHYFAWGEDENGNLVLCKDGVTETLITSGTGYDFGSTFKFLRSIHHEIEVSDFILDGASWSAQDMVDYYNATVGNYPDISVNLHIEGHGSISPSCVNIFSGQDVEVENNGLRIGGRIYSTTPDEGYVFDHWEDANGTTLNNGDTFTLYSDASYTAFFTPHFIVNIVSNDDTKGTVDISEAIILEENVPVVKNGDELTIGSITITATPEAGYAFLGWLTRPTINGNTTITAAFYEEGTTPTIELDYGDISGGRNIEKPISIHGYKISTINVTGTLGYLTQDNGGCWFAVWDSAYANWYGSYFRLGNTRRAYNIEKKINGSIRELYSQPALGYQWTNASVELNWNAYTCEYIYGESDLTYTLSDYDCNNIGLFMREDLSFTFRGDDCTFANARVVVTYEEQTPLISFIDLDNSTASSSIGAQPLINLMSYATITSIDINGVQTNVLPIDEIVDGEVFYPDGEEVSCEECPGSYYMPSECSIVAYGVTSLSDTDGNTYVISGDPTTIQATSSQYESDNVLTIMRGSYNFDFQLYGGDDPSSICQCDPCDEDPCSDPSCPGYDPCTCEGVCPYTFTNSIQEGALGECWFFEDGNINSYVECSDDSGQVLVAYYDEFADARYDITINGTVRNVWDYIFTNVGLANVELLKQNTTTFDQTSFAALQDVYDNPTEANANTAISAVITYASSFNGN